MEAAHAEELLARERARVEAAIARLRPSGSAGDGEEEPGDRDSEDLYQKEFDSGQAAELRDELAAVERAEARLRAGTYGLSIQSGLPIPDERLEALPTAELTVEEQARRGS